MCPQGACACRSCRSPEPQSAGDDAAQDLARAAAEREGRRVLDQVAEDALELAARAQARLDPQERVDHFGDLLLEARAHVLDHGGLEVRILARLQHARHGQRHLPEGRHVRDQPSDDDRRAFAGFRACLADQLDDELDGGEVALGAAPLEGELRRHLLPPVAVLAYQHVVRHEDVLEVHFVEMTPAGQVDDGPDADALRLQVHEKLREPLVLLVGHDLGAEERDRVVRDVRVARPDLGAVDAVAAFDALGPRADRGKVRARVGLAHPDGEGQLALRDPRQEALALLFRAEAQQQRPALPVGDPVRGGRRAGGQRLLEDDVALERAPLVAAVLLRPRHADEAGLAQLAREVAVEAAPGERALGRARPAERAGEEVAYLLTDLLRLRGKLAQLEVEGGHGASSYRKRDRAMTMRCTSDGPSPMRRTRASRYQRSRGNSLLTP